MWRQWTFSQVHYASTLVARQCVANVAPRVEAAIMPVDLLQRPANQVTRKDRAVEDDAWLRALLRRAPLGTLATIHDGQPFLNTNLFVYDETGHAIYLHTARVSRTRANLQYSERVCFSANEMGRLLPADAALEFSVEYASVVAFGRGAVVTERDEARLWLQLLLDKYAPRLRPGVDYRAPVDEEIRRTTVYRMQIESWSGKRKQVAADFPGAFWYAGETEFTHPLSEGA
jgi:nitroimidazol reductase NimA-like FMN-containing flavoprotein (pyridoxamine 5'-phosphate oxidase superfamily)